MRVFPEVAYGTVAGWRKSILNVDSTSNRLGNKSRRRKPSSTGMLSVSHSASWPP
jgi:hypothetical protein